MKLRLSDLPEALRAKVRAGAKTPAVKAIEAAKRKLRDQVHEDRAKAFFARLDEFGIRHPEREVRFVETRRWRFDFAWVHLRLAVEVDGGGFLDGGGGHTRGEGFHDDLAKHNAAALMGWTVLRFPPGRLTAVETAEEVCMAYNLAHGTNRGPLPRHLATAPSRRKGARPPKRSP